MKYINEHTYWINTDAVILAFHDHEEEEALASFFTPEELVELKGKGQVVREAPWASLIYTVNPLLCYKGN